MKVIKDVRKVGNTKYERVTGGSLNLLDIIERLEEVGVEFCCNNGNFYVGKDTEYTVTINGKDVDARDVHVTLEDNEEYLSELSFFSEEGSDELSEEELNNYSSLNELNKAELISRIRELESE